MSNNNELEEFIAQQVAEEIRNEIDANLLADLIRTMEKPKLVWKEHKHKPLVLHAGLEYTHGAVTQTGLRGTDLDPVQEWCTISKCGVRISFDMFRFKNRAEITAFLLVWG
jgi:hypothetical protein